MCNACGNVCCGSDAFSGCGCDGCEEPDCWTEDDDFEEDDDEYDTERTQAFWETIAARPFGRCRPVCAPPQGGDHG